MYRNEMKGKRKYVVLLFVKVNPEYYELDKGVRVKISEPHIKELTEHLKTVSLTSLQGTGLSRNVMVEVLESENLLDIEKMVETYKAGAKAKYGIIEEVLITEKTMIREMTG